MENSKVFKFSLLQWFFWSSWATFGAYIVYYLSDKGYSNTEIGLIITIRTVTGLIGEPILAYLCDLLNTNKKIFVFGLFIIGLVFLPFGHYSWQMMLITMGIIGFFWAPQQSILDSWIIKSSPKLADNYGFMRAWGSVGFALVVVIFGLAIDRYGWHILFPTYSLLLLISIIIALFIGDVAGNEVIKKGKESKLNPLILFKNLDYTILVLSTILVFIPHTVIFIFLPNFVKDLGGTPSLLGYILFFSALSEAPILFLGKGLIKKFKPIILLFISTIFYAIRVIVVFEAVRPFHLLTYGILQSLSFAVLLLTARAYIKQIAPSGLQTTAQTIFTMAAFGVGGIIASLFGGFILDNFGINTLYYLCLSLSLLAIVLIAFLVYKQLLKKSRVRQCFESK